ncbi:MmcQ/YjbR family DNA-binding protein [Sphingomonas sp. RS2018]
MIRDWDDAVAVALALPETEASTSYGAPAVKLRGKMLIAATSPDPDSFVLHVAEADKAVLMETDPDTFWQTPHYDGWPAVLVRYGTHAQDRIRLLIDRAWWDRASKTQQKARGGERP